jgi:hypothetical protein
VKREGWLWLGLVLGPSTWFVLLIASYAVTPGAHESSRAWTLRALHGGALLLAIAATVISWRELSCNVGDVEQTVLQRRRFVAIFALVVSVLSILLVVGSALPTLLLWPGSEP